LIHQTGAAKAAPVFFANNTMRRRSGWNSWLIRSLPSPCRLLVLAAARPSKDSSPSLIQPYRAKPIRRARSGQA